ncbi:cell wall metabolism sensor histidine kinase WalK [Demequina sp. NBRC 110057]|uniref:sensor histidine kinase n=1 Tax=Demequina sp. NBRC 110057 TaxID=1570346 RepID=UPI001F38052C|nr:HAMP domain-containing sensor histidine kinase [Demequina sp. NBRC 110057]
MRLSQRLGRVSVRARIGLAVLALTGLALALAGLVALAVLDDAERDRMHADLVSDLQEFVVLAEEGVDPVTGEPFTDPGAAVRTSMERNVPDTNEGVVGFLDGSLEWVSRDAQTPLADDQAFLDAVSPLTEGDAIVYTSLSTPTADYLVAVAPARQSEDGGLVVGAAGTGAVPVAAQVLAYDVNAELGLLHRAFRIYALVAAGAFVAVGALAWLLAGRLLRPVGALAEAAQRIGREDLTERVTVTGADDVSDMARSVNTMLDRLEAAFESQTALLNDVSHELRTPITVVRGHLELMDADDPGDAREVRDLSLEELDRMTALVEDLLTLAKADRPDFVTTAPVDVRDLTLSVLDKAAALGPRTWELDEAADAVANLDRDRVTQAWLQLASNAVRFSDEGSRVSLGSRVREGRLELWVSDEGVGVADEDRERIFDRFGQAHSSRRDGSGLGLSIVVAIARGHAGHVDLASVPGAGSTFTLSLPHPSRGQEAPES